MVYAHYDRVTLLKNEHRGITRQLDLVRNAIIGPSLASSGELRKSIGRLASLIDAHIANEETILYKPLKLKLGRDNPVDEMAREHRLIRQTLGWLISASVEYNADRSLIGELRSCFDSIQKEMGEHIEKEEKVLFWLADLRL